MNTPANIINHIVLVIDASYSMQHLTREVVKVADNQIEYLARRSKELDQETRITVYTFNTTGYVGAPEHHIDCLIYDKDVLRVPSISGLYKADGATPLIDATFTALDDLAMTPEKYGEHSFLVYVLTDGEENTSRRSSYELSRKIDELADNWTLATFVPDQNSVYEAKKFGFPKDNIAVWDATSSKGVSEMGERIRETTEVFMQNRSRGIRGSRSLFTLATPSVGEVENNLNNLTYGSYEVLDVDVTGRIDDFVKRATGHPYVVGRAFYELIKTETIQPQKQIAILANGRVYTGYEARDLLGLPDEHVKVRPNNYQDYTIFVQSTSTNRKMLAGQKLLVLR